MAYNKINWEAGKVSKEGYVIVDGQQYQTVQPEYEGNTPINPDNLNHMDQGIADAHDLLEDSGWIDVTDFGKNITYYDPYNRPRYRKIGKVVYLQGYAKTTAQFPAAVGNKVTLFTLPVGYRPVREITAVCQGSGMNRWVFQIGINGEATMDRYGTNEAVAIQSNVWLAISSVSFLTN